ncbi:MAG: hypothetical protein M3P04_14075, partial [Actinomycetota bacterium]|nr:hypothetical protein [Actinomycetota bacterium]
AARVRGETLVLAWLLAVSAGATVIAWLPAFLALWVGSQYDAGGRATVLICVMVLQFALIRVDSNVIDVTLHVRGKVLLGVLSAALSVVLGVLLVGPADLGIAGLVVAFVIGRLPVTVAYPLLVGRLLQLPHPFRLDVLWRPALTSVALFASGAWLRGVSDVSGWLSLLTLGSLTAVVATATAYGAGLTRSQRRDVRARVLRVVRAA